MAGLGFENLVGLGLWAFLLAGVSGSISWPMVLTALLRLVILVVVDVRERLVRRLISDDDSLLLTSLVGCLPRRVTRSLGAGNLLVLTFLRCG